MSKRLTGRHAISIHAPREEGDMGIPTGVDGISVFLSTPPARRATHDAGGLFA